MSLSDEEFSSIPVDTAMERIDAEVERYGQELNQYNQQQEQVQQDYAPTEQQDYSEQDSGQQVQPEQPQLDPNVYKEAYEFIMQPFKAAGKEFQLRDFHEARGLMQQGIDYTKKQQQLKPRLMEMRALENNGMLGENLNYAIDLFQGKPEAVAKLIRDRKIDLNSLQTGEAHDEWGNPTGETKDEYIPTNHRLTESQYELEDTIQELKQSPQYEKLSKYLNGIDDASGRHFFNNPKDLKILQKMVESGYHDEVINEIDYLRAVNNPSVAGLNDYDAYNRVGRMIVERKYAQLQQQQGIPNQNAPVPQQQQFYNNQQPQLTPVQQQQMYQQYQQQMQMQQRKQSVSPVRNTGRVAPPRQYDPLFSNVSDEEFAKIDINELMRN